MALAVGRKPRCLEAVGDVEAHDRIEAEDLEVVLEVAKVPRSTLPVTVPTSAGGVGRAADLHVAARARVEVSA